MQPFQVVLKAVSAGTIAKVGLTDEATPELVLYSTLPKHLVVEAGDDLVCMLDSELRVLSCEVFRKGEKIDPK